MPSGKDVKSLLGKKWTRVTLADHLGIDIFHPMITTLHLFGDQVNGAALLELIWSFYGDGVFDIPFYIPGTGEVDIHSNISKLNSPRRISKKTPVTWLC
jgi:hypothetical protein